MPEITLSSIHRYPVKSMRGKGFNDLDVDGRGLVNDRRWMLVDEDGRFLTQRQQARMSLIDTRVTAEGTLELEAPGMSSLAVAVAATDLVEVSVWGDRVQAQGTDPAVAEWLSSFLGIPCRLVSFAEDVVRPVDPDYANSDDQVGFADGFPFLLISQASLDDLNARLAQPLPMVRFRPNLVVTGCAAFAEDEWRRIRIGEIEFRVAKPCSRCVIPTIDPHTAERAAEPLRTLMGYRRRDNKVYFGQNLIHDGIGRLSVGMPVEVLD